MLRYARADTVPSIHLAKPLNGRAEVLGRMHNNLSTLECSATQHALHMRWRLHAGKIGA